MTHNNISKTELTEMICSLLAQYGVTLEAFLASALDDLDIPEVRELWLLYHDVLVEPLAA